MARERGARGAPKGNSRARARRGGRPTAILVASALAVLAVAGLIWIGNSSANEPTASVVSISGVTRVRGAADAPVTIDEYADFQCPACAQFARTTEQQLLATYIAAGKVRLIFHHFAFLGMESNWAAEAAECAGEQGKFWEFHDRLYASQAGENRGAFSRDNLKRIGTELGLSPAYAACVDSGRYASAVRDSSRASEQRGVRATPTFFIGERKIEGVPSIEQLRTIIDPLLSK